MQPELLYLRDQPYTRLYVEVDMMEGAEVPQEWLDELEAFLARYCHKPDGVTVVRDEPVPGSALVDLPLDYGIIMCTDGPPADRDDQPAYLHMPWRWSPLSKPGLPDAADSRGRIADRTALRHPLEGQALR